MIMENLHFHIVTIQTIVGIMKNILLKQCNSAPLVSVAESIVNIHIGGCEFLAAVLEVQKSSTQKYTVVPTLPC